MRIVFLGPPGAGKGTHAAMVGAKLGIPHISMGDLLRERITRGTAVGLRAKQYVENGRLVPDELVIEMMAERLVEADTREGFLLDGFPRTLRQAEAFDAKLRELQLTLDVVVNFKVSLDTLITRLTGRLVCPNCKRNYHQRNIPPKRAGLCDDCGSELAKRKDDAEDTIQTRLKVYERETAPLIGYYEKKELAVHVNGDLELHPLDEEIAGVLGRVHRR